METTEAVTSKWKRNAKFHEVYGDRLQRRWVEEFAEKAQVAQPWLWESCRDWVEPDIVAWFVDRLEGGADWYPGALVGRKFKTTALDRMQCLAASVWRCQRTGRCLMLDQVIDMVAKDDEALDVFGIFVPDFYVAGRTLTPKQQSVVHRFLQARAIRVKDGLAHTTVLFVDNPKDMRESYGEAITGFLLEHYLAGSSLT